MELWHACITISLGSNIRSTPCDLAQEGSKAIFHLEAFVARFMSDYKTFLVNAMA